MSKNFDDIFDECVDRINRGESLEKCLASYPEYVEELEPALRTLLHIRADYSFSPSASAKMKAKRQFQAALGKLEQERREQRPVPSKLFGWSRAWVTVTAVLVLAVIGYFGLRPMLLPEEAPSPLVLSQVNFVFLISDEVNAIEDFESLEVTITGIGLLPEGESDGWIELEPAVQQVDLTLLQGDNAQEIWRGDIPEGRYIKVFIYVADVSGVLKATGQTVDVKLPSNKLHISKPFEVSGDSVVSFVYDLTVVATGGQQFGVKYILQPQVGQSGADQKFREIKGEGKGP